MARLKLALFTILIFTLAASLYGAIHNQVTYSISPEYFTKFKFHQFQWAFADFTANIGSEDKPEYVMSNNRIGASLVGILATWWFGLLMVIVFAIVIILARANKQHNRFLRRSFVYVFATTIVSGFIALVMFKMGLLSNICTLDHVANKNLFSLAGWIHNFSYLGGLLGLVVGLSYFINKLVSSRTSRKLKSV